MTTTSDQVRHSHEVLVQKMCNYKEIAILGYTFLSKLVECIIFYALSC